LKIFVGLGNPGKKYQKTRHNIGYRVIENLRRKNKIKKTFREKLFTGWELTTYPFILIKPKTFMNESGISVKRCLEFFDEIVENLVVIHDDLDIPFGKIKIVFKKGPGGHKGVISIVENINSKDFVRIRIGIGGGNIEVPYIDYVLSEFSPEEEKKTEEIIEKACSACIDLEEIGIEKTMTKYNN